MVCYFRCAVGTGARNTTHQRVVSDEKQDGVVDGVQIGEGTIICLEYEVCVRDPNGWHASWCEVTL